MAAGAQFTTCQLFMVLVSMTLDPKAYTLNYCLVDDAFAIVTALGKDSLMAKIDLQNAFRLIPVRPERLEPSRYSLEEPILHRHLPAIWAQVSSIFIQSTSGCHSLVPPT